MVWLYSPVVAKGKSKKLHHPWLGPYRIIKKLSDLTYRVQHHLNMKKRTVVHFDRLKPCQPGTRHPHVVNKTRNSVQSSRTYNIGDNLEVVDDYPDEVNCAEMPTPRYPTRTRHLPDCYGTVILY